MNGTVLRVPNDPTYSGTLPDNSGHFHIRVKKFQIRVRVTSKLSEINGDRTFLKRGEMDVIKFRHLIKNHPHLNDRIMGPS